MTTPRLTLVTSVLAASLPLFSPPVRGADDYTLGWESDRRLQGVEKGTLTFFEFDRSKIFADTTRGCWLYVPQAYTGEEAAALMVFQDGHAYVSEDGQMRVPIVLDNLIARGELPVTISLFINPGHRGPDEAPHDRWGTRSNRSIEYDTPNADYANFLIDELLPHVVQTYGIKLSQDPERRAISGMSSGGICAWTVAWERPDQFGKVLSHIGSFTNIRGGHVYPALIRKTERKPIRVFLQDGANDLNNAHGSWPIANQQMASALAFAGYDHRFVYGTGAHNGLHGGATLPDSLRWLWRGWNNESESDSSTSPSDHSLTPREASWIPSGDGYQFTDGACIHPDGSLFFSDLPNGAIYRLAPDAEKPELWLGDGPRISGMDFAPDGALFAAVQGRDESVEKSIVRIDPEDKAITTVATRVNPNDLVVSRAGFLFFTDTEAGTVARAPLTAREMSRPPVVAGGIVKPNGIALSPDQSILYVSEFGGTHVWRFPLAPNGDLRGGERFATLSLSADREGTAAGGDGMVVSPDGDLYVTSHAGIQVFNADGKAKTILTKPQEGATVSVALSQDTLHACSGDKIFRFPLKTVASDWRTAGGDPHNRQYASLNQINRQNVHLLEQAWIYHCGDADTESNRTEIQCNPIIVHGKLYGTSPQLKLIALSGDSGNPLWTFDPFTYRGEHKYLGVNRGVVHWESDDPAEERILFTAGHRLFAIRASDGLPIEEFGDHGTVDLREGLDREPSGLNVLSNSPGVIFQDLLILGTRVGEGPGPSAPGHIRAYDVRTGEIRWTFRTIPQPGEFGYDTWPEPAWEYAGGANAWSGLSVDHARGMVFLPTGSPAFDFWGGNRKGSNLFGNCLLALNAATGERLWHFQMVHHDLWDRDLPAAPNLVRLQHQGAWVDAVAQVTKTGHVFTFDRRTGKPIFPIKEVPVPGSDLLGEAAWPTQPLPTAPPPFARQRFTPDLITDISPRAHAEIKERYDQVRSGETFLPPSETGTVIFPGFDGGGEWGGAAWDQEEGLLIVNGNEMPWIHLMLPIDDANQPRGHTIYRRLCIACHGEDRQGSKERGVASLVGIHERRPKAEAGRILKEGQGLMPPFAFLTEDERNELIDYLYEADTTPGSESPQSANRETTTPAIAEEDVVFDTVESPYTHDGYDRFFDSDGYPAVKPPWGTLNAIDLNRGTIRWQVTLGEFAELTEKGLPPTGTENYGGPIATSGGLVFIGASKDEKFRAFDKMTGELLWETQLPAGGYATPATYAIDGVQYVVIAAGGGKMKTESGDAYVAFRLPLSGE